MKKPWVETIRRASGLVEHICKHGVGHPAIGSVLWMEENGAEGYDIHGCDGCCNDPEWKLQDALEGLRIATKLMLEYKRTIRNLRRADSLMEDDNGGK